MATLFQSPIIFSFRICLSPPSTYHEYYSPSLPLPNPTSTPLQSPATYHTFKTARPPPLTSHQHYSTQLPRHHQHSIVLQHLSLLPFLSLSPTFHLLLSFLLPFPMPRPLHCFPPYRSTAYLKLLRIETNHTRNHPTPYPHMHPCWHNPSYPTASLHPNHPITSLRRPHLSSTSKTHSQPPHPQLLHYSHQYPRTYSSSTPIPPCI